MRVGGKCFSAVQHPFAIFQDSGGAGARGIRTGLRLGQRPATNPFARGKLRNIFFLLRFISRQKNVIGAQRIVSGHYQRHARIHACQLFDNDRIVDVAEPGASQVLRKNGAHDSQLTGLLDYLERKKLSFVPFENVRRDLGLGKLADRLPKFDLLGGILKIHGAIFWRLAPVLE